MSTLSIIIIVLVVLLLTLIYIVNNLLRKVEKYEDILDSDFEYIQKLSNTLVKGQKHLKELDSKGVFQSDDEVGYYFEQLKNVQIDLDKFIVTKSDGQKKEQG